MGEANQSEMKAVRWEGAPFSVSVKSIPIPTITHPTDALIRITSAAICGTDLHTYHGRDAMVHPLTFGHENLGIVQSVGSSVMTIKPGDRVVVNCVGEKIAENGGMTLTNSWGTPTFGDEPSVNGGQAEYMVVTDADSNLLILPEGDEHELDYLLLADIWPTSWFALESAGQVAGETVAVFGAGKYSASLVLPLPNTILSERLD